MSLKPIHIFLHLIIVTHSCFSWSKSVTPRSLASAPQRESFSCSLWVGNEYRDGGRQRSLVNIPRQPVILGVGSNPLDLQPIFEGIALDQAYNSNIKIMGTLFYNDAGKLQLKLGLYAVALNMSRFTAATHHLFPSANGESSHFARPIQEVFSDFENQDEMTLESTGVIAGSTSATYTKVKCRHVARVQFTSSL